VLFSECKDTKFRDKSQILAAIWKNRLYTALFQNIFPWLTVAQTNQRRKCGLFSAFATLLCAGACD